VLHVRSGGRSSEDSDSIASALLVGSRLRLVGAFLRHGLALLHILYGRSWKIDFPDRKAETALQPCLHCSAAYRHMYAKEF
jgi:hypothetical protein